MNKLTVYVRKPFSGHFVGDEIKIDERDLERLMRQGRVRTEPIPEKGEDPRRGNPYLRDAVRSQKATQGKGIVSHRKADRDDSGESSEASGPQTAPVTPKKSAKPKIVPSDTPGWYWVRKADGSYVEKEEGKPKKLRKAAADKYLAENAD